MLSTQDLLRLKVRARDGDIGTVRDLRFNDADWTVRDIEVDTGAWIFGRRVLIDPDMLLEPDIARPVLEVDLTKDEVKSLPEAGTTDAAAITSNEETFGIGAVSDALSEGRLHSLRSVEGYTLLAGEERAGTLKGFLIDTVAWDLPLALVLLPDETTVLLPSRLITGVIWPEKTIAVSIEAERIKGAPIYDARIEDERVFLPVVTDYYASLTPAA